MNCWGGAREKNECKKEMWKSYISRKHTKSTFAPVPPCPLAPALQGQEGRCLLDKFLDLIGHWLHPLNTHSTRNEVFTVNNSVENRMKRYDKQNLILKQCRKVKSSWVDGLNWQVLEDINLWMLFTLHEIKNVQEYWGSEILKFWNKPKHYLSEFNFIKNLTSLLSFR